MRNLNRYLLVEKRWGRTPPMVDAALPPIMLNAFDDDKARADGFARWTPRHCKVIVYKMDVDGEMTKLWEKVSEEYQEMLWQGEEDARQADHERSLMDAEWNDRYGFTPSGD